MSVLLSYAFYFLTVGKHKAARMAVGVRRARTRLSVGARAHRLASGGSQSACLADSMSTGHPRSFPTGTERGSAKVNKADLRSDRG